MRKVIYAFVAILVMGVGLLILWARTASRPATLGVQEGRLADCPESPNCVSSYALDDVHKVEVLAFNDDPVAAIERLRSAIESMPRVKVITESEDYLHAEFRSALIGFIDDVEFLVDPREKVIHVRSASRLGYSDLGVNRERVEKIRTAFRDG